jgi:large subunit ribosomal protein L24
MKLRKGDDIIVLAGKYRGERATIAQANPSAGLVVLDTLNISKRHSKQTSKSGAMGVAIPAGIIDKFMPMDASNVALWCSGHRGPAKVGYEVKDGKKHRVCNRCGEAL